jgi:large subunit ribosomal protein L21
VYAIIEDSGQQFRVCEGDVIDVDTRDLAENAEKVEFDRVLLVGNDQNVKIGTPLVTGAKVVADIVDPRIKGVKVHIFHWRRRKASRTKTGHRQKYLRVRIAQIVA